MPHQVLRGASPPDALLVDVLPPGDLPGDAHGPSRLAQSTEAAAAAAVAAQSTCIHLHVPRFVVRHFRWRHLHGQWLRKPRQ